MYRTYVVFRAQALVTVDGVNVTDEVCLCTVAVTLSWRGGGVGKVCPAAVVYLPACLCFVLPVPSLPRLCPCSMFSLFIGCFCG